MKPKIWLVIFIFETKILQKNCFLFASVCNLKITNFVKEKDRDFR